MSMLSAINRGYGQPNNPLDIIQAGQFDSKSHDIRLEACSLGGRDICFVHDGDYVVYKHYDFDSGVAAFKASIATVNHGRIEIRFDSKTGPLAGICRFSNTGGWQSWNDVGCDMDSSLSGVRDIYLVFHGNSKGSLVNVSSFVFQKSILADTGPKLSSMINRVDTPDGEPQAANGWGEPESLFTDSFDDGASDNWITHDMVISLDQADSNHALTAAGVNLSFALTPNAYINKTDTGGEWRTLAEASLSADLDIGNLQTRSGIGFASLNMHQAVFALLNSSNDTIEVWRKLSENSLVKMKGYDMSTNLNLLKRHIRLESKYHLQLDWSPYSDALIVFLNDEHGNQLANFRTVVDLPAARHPLLLSYGSGARFSNVQFDPTLDDWDFKWQWKKQPVLTPDACNPAVWKWKDEKYYMIWRKFGRDTYHGIASSTDGIHWERLSDQILKCTGDMNVLVDPFGDGLVYVTAGGDNMPWFTSDGSAHFTNWKNSGLNLGSIRGNSRIQEIIDTKKYRQLAPIHFDGAEYRFIAFTENWTDTPKPHTVILLSNTLTNWILADPNPLIPPRADFWGEKGSAIGSAIPLPDGNILIASCSCTFAGYTGAPEPSNVSAIVDGKEPWRVLKLGVLPDAPVSRENVWYEGPNFGTAFYYEPETDTLFYYGGFHDYSIGVMRVQNFAHSKLFVEEERAKTAENIRAK
ncbi:MAG TPA: carbohydrate-binding protein [Verrucomicrobiae bacterium]